MRLSFLTQIVISFVLWCAFFALFLITPPHIKAQTIPDFACDGFSETYPGIEYATDSISAPRDITWFAVRADLNNPNLDLMVTPRDGLGRITSSFASTYSAVVATNGDGFVGIDPNGRAAAEGDEYSQASAEPTFYISEDNQVRFFGLGGGALWDALSGQHTIVQGGSIPLAIRNCAQPGVYCTDLHPRTAIGLTNSNELILLVVDGRQSGYSEGVSLLELANMMDTCGVQSAINMDGGGSSTMYVGNEGGVVNSPSDGNERIVANHFGICLGQCLVSSQVPPGPALPEGEARPRYTSSQPYPFPCNRVAPDNSSFGDKEFHSLRPYQASPCNQNQEDIALFCGSDLTISEDVTVEYDVDNPPPTGNSPPGPTPPPTGDPGTFGCQWVQGPRPEDSFCGVGSVGCSPGFLPNPGFCAMFQQVNTCNVAGQSCYAPDGNTAYCSPASVAANHQSCCVDNGDGTSSCYFYVNGSRDIVVDVSGAELPIMGYTEPSVSNLNDPFRVINNYYTGDETVTNADKVNEYVSWYLNGINDRAEYGLLNPTEFRIDLVPGPVDWGIRVVHEEDRRKLIDYSGPLKKLLSHRSQRDIRKDSVTGDNNPPRHDQVAGCTLGIDIPRLCIPFTNICYPGSTLGGFPVPCSTPGAQERRLSDWTTRLPPEEDDPAYDHWTDWYVDYQRWRGNFCAAVNIPAFVPFIGGRTFSICGENPFSANFWSNLFPNIPFSSTEDRLGSVEIQSTTIQPISPNVYVISTSITNQQPADLFFPHMEENYKLADILQQTFVYKDGPKDDITPTNTQIPDWCDLTRIRTNPGDELFAGEVRATFNYEIVVSGTFFNGNGITGEWCGLLGNSCEDENQLCGESYGNLDCPSGQMCASDCSPPSIGGICAIGGTILGECVHNSWTDHCIVSSGNSVPQCPSPYVCGAGCEDTTFIDPPIQTTSVTFQLTMDLITKSPMVDKIWSKLVSGPAAVFKKFTPRLDLPTSPIGCLLDIPAATAVSYTSPDPIIIGNPSSQRPYPELYFPHIGSIHEYFLKGVQTMLRPQGFGEPIEYGNPGDPMCDTSINQGSDICSLACSDTQNTYDIPSLVASCQDLALRWFGVPYVGNPREEDCQNVIDASIAAGVDPAFTVAIWLHETGASNYQGICEVFGASNPYSPACNWAQDFGINRSEVTTTYSYNPATQSITVNADHFDDQLAAFLNIPGYYLNYCPEGAQACPMAVFGAVFRYGDCSADPRYVLDIRQIFDWLGTGQVFPCYPIDIP